MKYRTYPNEKTVVLYFFSPIMGPTHMEEFLEEFKKHYQDSISAYQRRYQQNVILQVDGRKLEIDILFLLKHAFEVVHSNVVLKDQQPSHSIE